MLIKKLICLTVFRSASYYSLPREKGTNNYTNYKTNYKLLQNPKQTLQTTTNNFEQHKTTNNYTSIPKTRSNNHIYNKNSCTITTNKLHKTAKKLQNTRAQLSDLLVVIDYPGKGWLFPSCLTILKRYELELNCNIVSFCLR